MATGTSVAANDVGNDTVIEWANRLNLDLDLKLTATERLHMFLRPLDRAGKTLGIRWSDNNDDNGGDGRVGRVDAGVETVFCEGEAGALIAGLSDEYQSFDLPFSVGLLPILTQNGLWTNDAFIGGGFALPSLNSATPAITI